MTPLRVAWFVSPHGFGHAARSSAIIEALAERLPELEVELFTSAPRWFFEDSVTVPFRRWPDLVDLGLVQRDSLTEDLPATVERLRGFLPFSTREVERLARQVKALGCRAVVCDIAPLGLEVARVAGAPSVLVENFTWDWIYRGYSQEEPELVGYADYLATRFDLADLRIQTEPVCHEAAGAARVPPVSRPPRRTREPVRGALGIHGNEQMVLVTMGGIRWRFDDLDLLEGLPSGIRPVIPGAAEVPSTRGPAVLLPHRSGFHHADLVHAADGVVGKLGYSTVAEVVHAGIPFAYLERPRFRESGALARFVQDRVAALRLQAEELADGRWVRRLPDLVALERRSPARDNGASAAAALIEESLAPP